MKKFLINIMLLVLMITACSPEFQGTDAPADEMETDVPTAEPEQILDPLEQAVVKQLAANLTLKQSDISLVINEPVEFADACMGVAMEGVVCAEVATDGNTIVLEAKGIQYEYRVSADGERIQPATLAMIWKREGGIAGFCDSMTVFLSGEVYGNQCRSEPDGTMDTFANLFSATDRKQFDAWARQFGEVTLDASDPRGVSDRMEVTLALSGLGTGKPTTAQQQALFTWAQSLFQKLYS
ncbi:MAG: hypothetical protein M3R47_03885 [Chloroflexota bacterium]|nr:hypothetical protein [Chloroflexota bacterium]